METHNTLIGGFFTFWINIALYIYIGLNVIVLVTGDGDSNVTTTTVVNIMEEPPVDYTDSDFRMLTRFKK